jgi:glycosyltransferase involved in cell wall biosynthesis
VLTRGNNRRVIEAEVGRNPVGNLHFIYHDLPPWARFWKRGQRGVHLYYYLWQLTAVPIVRRLHREVGFDVVQHVTLAKYWAPSALAFVKGVAFVWGPVGGGESAPLSFWPTLGLKGFLYEVGRTLARFLAELDPLVRVVPRRATLALTSTTATAAKLTRLGARRVDIMSQMALPEEDIKALRELPGSGPGPVKFLSVGRLLAWKGFHLGIIAFAKTHLNDAEYWIIGDGPERKRLESLARRLGVAARVRFLGKYPRDEVLRLLARAHALVHPSLHDQNPTVILEAMAAGRPVICLDLGGPAMQVTEETGFKVAPSGVSDALEALAWSMREVVRMWETGDCNQMGTLAAKRVAEGFSWTVRVKDICRIFRLAVETGALHG